MVASKKLSFLKLIEPKNILNFEQWKFFLVRIKLKLTNSYLINNSLQKLNPVEQRIYKIKDPFTGKILVSPTFAQKETIKHYFFFDKEHFYGVSETVNNLGGKYILDIGANIGYFSRLYALTGQNLEILSIEPNIFNFSFLSYNLSDLKNVFLYHFGLSDDFGRYTVSMPEYAKSRIGEKKYITGLLTAINNKDDFGTRFLKGDEFLNFINILPFEIGWIKIDVEGFEQNVLNGFSETLESTNAVVELEINSIFLKISQKNLSFFINKMGSYSYLPFKKIIYNHKYIDHKKKLSFDIYFVKSNLVNLLSKKLEIDSLNEEFIRIWEEKYRVFYGVD